MKHEQGVITRSDLFQQKIIIKKESRLIEAALLIMVPARRWISRLVKNKVVVFPAAPSAGAERQVANELC